MCAGHPTSGWDDLVNRLSAQLSNVHPKQSSWPRSHSIRNPEAYVAISMGFSLGGGQMVGPRLSV